MIWSDLNGQPIASIGEKGKDKGKKGKGKDKQNPKGSKGSDKQDKGKKQEHVSIVINEATLPVIAHKSIRPIIPKVKAIRKVQTKAKVRPIKVQRKERKEERMRKESRKENMPLSFNNSPNQKSQANGLSQNSRTAVACPCFRSMPLHVHSSYVRKWTHQTRC